jgi:hypothetical protein
VSRNVIAGNSRDGVLIGSSATGVLVQSNVIGLNMNSSAIANSIGVEVQGSSNTITGDLISGNTGDGVLLSGSGNQVLGNYIGTDRLAGSAVANGSNGIEVQSSSNTISGVISGNKGDGVLIKGNSNSVQTSYIGTNSVGSVVVANGQSGIEVQGSNNTIGGARSISAAHNTIAGNRKDGVLVSAGSGNTIRSNAIYANGPTSSGPGIVLSGGANGGLTPPSITSAKYASSTLTVTGTFSAAATGSYVLEFFANYTWDVEGMVWFGSLTVSETTTGSVPFTFSTTSVPDGVIAGISPVITATVTDPASDTSAFSGGVTIS